MPYKEITAAKDKTVGTKQTLKAIKKNQAKLVYVANDAEKHVIEPLVRACEERGIPYVRVETMKALGKACSINVECAVAAIIKQ